MTDAVHTIRAMVGDLDSGPGSHARLVRRVSLLAGVIVVATATAVGAVAASPFADALPAGVAGLTNEAISLSVLAAVALLVAWTAADDLATVGLVGLGVFALLGAAAEAAFLPAAVVVLLGGTVATARSLSPEGGWRHAAERDRGVVLAAVAATAIVAGTAASLAGGAGIEPGALRPAGGILLFAGFVLLPIWVRIRPGDAAAGAFVAALLVGGASLAPVVAETALLAGLSIVGVPVLLVGIGAGSVVAAISRSLRARRPTTALGAGLMLAAGAPASLPAATATLLGVAAIALREGEPE